MQKINTHWQITQRWSLPVCGGTYAGVAFDLRCYIFTLPSLCQMHRYSQHFQKIDCIAVPRPYTSITYDPQRHCFWACVKDCWDYVFALDFSFKEIGGVRLFSHEGYAILPTGISCTENSETLLLAYDYGIAILDIATGCLRVVRRPVSGVRFTAVEKTKHNALVGYATCEVSGVSLLEDNVSSPAFNIPPDYLLVDITETTPHIFPPEPKHNGACPLPCPPPCPPPHAPHCPPCTHRPPEPKHNGICPSPCPPPCPPCPLPPPASFLLLGKKDDCLNAIFFCTLKSSYREDFLF